MARQNRKNAIDLPVQQIREVLEESAQQHRHAKIDVKRYNPVAIRIRIIDPDFKGRDRADREPEIWTLLQSRLSDDQLADVTMLLLLTPDEARTSLANVEFDAPIPSRL